MDRHRHWGGVAKGLSSKELGRMLDDASRRHIVELPREIFDAVIALAREAALARNSPSFSVGELEAMLDSHRDREKVELEADDFRHLAALAMHAAPIE
jgi:hypothetical protein